MPLYKLKTHLSWDDLRVVLAVARTGSLSGAARELAVNHSTVLRRVAAFEAGLGVTLFARQANAYVLTAAGEEMVAAALRMEEELSASCLRISGMDSRTNGKVKVTTVDILAHHLLPAHMDAFHRAHPGISIEIDVSETPYDLHRGEADVAIRCLSRDATPPSHLVGRRVSGLAFAAYGAACAVEQAPHDLARHWWIGLDEGFANQMMVSWLAERVPDYRIRMRAGAFGTLFAAAKAGCGAALLPCALGDRAEDLTRLTDPIPELGGHIWLLTHPSLHSQGRVRAFLDFIGEALAGDCARLEGKTAITT